MLSGADIDWADAIFAMEHSHAERIRSAHRARLGRTPIHVLGIPDEYQFMDPELIQLLRVAIDEHIQGL